MLLLMVPLGIGFVWVRDSLDGRPIDWDTYSTASLVRHLDDGRTVLVNFTADWDVVTAQHEFTALRSPRVTRWLRYHRVVAMRADYTNHSPEINAALEAIDQISIPVVAVYSASHDPIVLSGMITEEQVLNGLMESRNESSRWAPQ